MIKQFRDTRYYCTPYGEVYVKNNRGFQKMKPHPDKNGYLKLSLYVSGGVYLKRAIHQIVYEAWIGAYDSKMTIDHKDFNKTNNRVYNLGLLTRSQNSAKKENPRFGYLNSQTLYSDEKAKEALLMRKDGETINKIAKQLNVPKHWVAQVCAGSIRRNLWDEVGYSRISPYRPGKKLAP